MFENQGVSPSLTSDICDPVQQIYNERLFYSRMHRNYFPESLLLGETSGLFNTTGMNNPITSENLKSRDLYY
jgi:hypothetical protein